MRDEVNSQHHIAVVVHDGMSHEAFERTMSGLQAKGQTQIDVIGRRLGSVLCSNGQRVAVDATLRRWRGSFFDVVYVMHAQEGSGELAEEVFISAAACAGALIVDVSAPEVTTRPMPVFALRPARMVPRLAALARLLSPSLVLGGLWTAANAYGVNADLRGLRGSGFAPATLVR